MSDLMTIDDIAAFWHISRRQALDRLTKRPDFPAVAPGSTRKHPLWHRASIRAYARGQSANDPAGIPHKARQAA